MKVFFFLTSMQSTYLEEFLGNKAMVTFYKSHSEEHCQMIKMIDTVT